MYWEPDSAVNNGSNIKLTQNFAQPYTQVDNGFTYTSPSVYVIYSSLRATATCSNSALHTIGPSFSEKTIAYSSNFLAYGTLSSPNGGCSEHEVVDGFHTIDFNSLYNSPIVPTTSTKAGCAPYINPKLSLPADLTTIDPAWKSCEPLFFGAFNPPSILRKPTSGLAPSPVAAGQVTNAPVPPAVAMPEFAKPIGKLSSLAASTTQSSQGSDQPVPQAQKTPAQHMAPQQTHILRPLYDQFLGYQSSLSTKSTTNSAVPQVLPNNSPSNQPPVQQYQAPSPANSPSLPPSPLGQPVLLITPTRGAATLAVATATSAIILVPVPAGAQSSPKPSNGDIPPSGGMDTKGSDTKGSDTKGSDTKGSDTKGSDTKGSDTKGADIKGSDTIFFTAASSPQAFVPGAQVKPAPVGHPGAVVAGSVSKPKEKLVQVYSDGKPAYEAVPVNGASLDETGVDGSSHSMMAQGGRYNLAQATVRPIDPKQTITLKGGNITAVPLNPPAQATALQDGVIITISKWVPRKTVTLEDGQVTAIPIKNALANNHASIPAAVTKSGKIVFTQLPWNGTNGSASSSGFTANTNWRGVPPSSTLNSLLNAAQNTALGVDSAYSTPTGSIHTPTATHTASATSSGHRLKPSSSWLLWFTLWAFMFYLASAGNNIWITSGSVAPESTQQRTSTAYNVGYGGAQNSFLGQNTAMTAVAAATTTASTSTTAIAIVTKASSGSRVEVGWGRVLGAGIGAVVYGLVYW